MKKNTIFKYCVSLAMGLALSSSLCASYDVTTVAGVAGSFAHTDEVGTAARFKSPGMMSINLSTGDLLVPGSDNNVRKVTTAGDVYAVSTLFNYNVGSPPVQAVCAYITSAGVPSIITTDNYSHLYQWIQSGGTYVRNSSLDAVSGPAYDGWGLVVDSSKNIFMTDGQSNRIFKILPNGSYSIFAGTGFSAGSADGTGAAARFNGITGITIDSSNNLYASDTGNKTIRKITPAGVVTTIAGTAGSSGSTDAAGSSARFNSPWDIDIDAAGNLYIADRGNNSIRKLTLSGATYTASTIAGSAGSPGSTDGTGSAARFNTPTGLAVDASGIIYVSDTGNNTIRRLAPPSMTIDVEGTDSASHSGAITVGILNKTDAGSLALSGANAIGNLAIQGGKVAISSASNLNGASSAVTFASSGTDPVTGAANTATLQIAGTMNTGAFAFTSAGTVQVDGSNVATLNAAPTGTGLVHKTGPGVMKVASDLSASATLAGINVDAGTFYLYGGKAPNAPIDVASGAVFELGGASALGQHAVPGLTTVRSGGEISVDANTSINTDATTNYTMNFVTGYLVGAGTGAVLPHPTGLSVTGLNSSGYAIYLNSTASSILYGSMNFPVGTTDPAATMIPTTYNQITYSPFDTGVLFASGSTLKLGAGSTWARNITVGTAS
jgi:sugar lactone lactonase YvrE